MMKSARERATEVWRRVDELDERVRKAEREHIAVEAEAGELFRELRRARPMVAPPRNLLTVLEQMANAEQDRHEHAVLKAVLKAFREERGVRSA